MQFAIWFIDRVANRKRKMTSRIDFLFVYLVWLSKSFAFECRCRRHCHVSRRTEPNCAVILCRRKKKSRQNFHCAFEMCESAILNVQLNIFLPINLSLVVETTEANKNRYIDANDTKTFKRQPSFSVARCHSSLAVCCFSVFFWFHSISLFSRWWFHLRDISYEIQFNRRNHEHLLGHFHDSISIYISFHFFLVFRDATVTETLRSTPKFTVRKINRWNKRKKNVKFSYWKRTQQPLKMAK